MTNQNVRRCSGAVGVCAAWALALMTTGVFAQVRAPAGRPPEPKPEAPTPSLVDGQVEVKPVDVVEAEVIEVAGRVDWAVAGVDVLATEGWSPVSVGDRLPAGSQIRTGLRSHVNLQFGDTTLVSVRTATHASIDEFYKSVEAETVRIGLAYGSVRGGSTEGEIRSDVVVDSPAATLAKRGTDGWQMQVEPASGRFKISLARHGLVEAIRKQRVSGRNTRNVRPGEYATESDIANLWVKQDIFDRNVKFYETNAVSTADAEFATANTRGFTVVAPRCRRRGQRRDRPAGFILRARSDRPDVRDQRHRPGRPPARALPPS